jgi:hypothetical protein
MYGSISNAQESVNLVPGIHEVKIESISLERLDTPKYAGEVMNVMFKTKQGASFKKSIFPFKPNNSFNDRKTGQPIPEKVQLDRYLSIHKHLFTKATIKTEEEFNAIMAAAIDFKSYASLLNNLCTGANADTFRCKFILKNGYVSIPDYSGGVAEKLTVNPSMLRFDMNTEGVSNTPDVTDTAAKADLPF